MAYMIDTERKCKYCGSWNNLEVHHCIHGNGRRKLADEDGLTVYLCHKCHMELHDKGIADNFLQKLAQNYYEFHIGTREQFRQRYGKSYL
jgi:Zn-finger protein